MSVSPDKLEFNLPINQKQIKPLLIANPTKDVMLFEVYADEFENIISAEPQSFTLESGGQKKINVIVNSQISDSPSFPKRGQGGVITTNLSIVGSVLAESRSNVSVGAKIPITITTTFEKSASPNLNNFGLILLFAIFIFCLIFWQKVFQTIKKLFN